MTSPLAMLAVATPSGKAAGTSASDGRGPRDGNDASNFSDVMARQRASQDAAAAAADASHPATADAQATDPKNTATPSTDGAGVDAGHKDDDKTAVEGSADAAPSLAQQALAIATMSMQLQGGQPDATQAGTAGQGPARAADSGGVAAAGTGSTTSPAPSAQSLPAISAAATDEPVATAPTDRPAAAQAGSPALAGASDPAAAGQVLGSVTPATPHAATPGAHQPAPGPQGRHANGRTTEAAGNAGASAMDTRGRETRASIQDDAPLNPAEGKSGAADKEGIAEATATAPRGIAHAPQADMTQALANAWQAPAAPASTNASPGPAIQTPVGQPQWGAELGGQLVLMTHRAGNDSHTAELRLDPPDLGPLRVTIKLSDGVAEASFVSAHAAVRQAVESALPQLQQTLAQAGISLGQANVSDHGAQAGFGGMHQGSDRPGQGAGQSTQSQADTAGDTVQIAIPSPRRANAGLVDTFA